MRIVNTISVASITDIKWKLGSVKLYLYYIMLGFVGLCYFWYVMLGYIRLSYAIFMVCYVRLMLYFMIYIRLC